MPPDLEAVDFALRMGFTRRQFLERLGQVGGSAAVYRAATEIGLLSASPHIERTQFMLEPPSSERRVVVVGAGIGGLVAAYELRKAGYECVVLEAADRAGGRNLTVRAGDTIDEVGHPQQCQFDDDPELYFNAGPARIPADHRRLLNYCRELGVRLEVFVNENRNALLYDEQRFGDRPVRNKHYVTDARGFLAELAAKSIDTAAFDRPLDGVDAEKLIEFLRAFGDLDPDRVYRGSARSGYASGGMLVPGVKRGTYDLHEILGASFWQGPLNFGEQEFQSAPMLQPVGGMDRIVAAFTRALGDDIQLSARVTSIRLQDNGVSVIFEKDGGTHRVEADYCLNNMPCHILASLDHNFPRAYAEALGAIPRGQLFKIGLQANRRFWEDEDIYGGISWTSQDITQIWYPSHGIFSAKGIVLGAYTFGDEGGARFARMAPEQRLELAIRQGEKLHPGYGSYIDNGVSIVWHRMRHLLGCAARWNKELIERHFSTLQRPAGRHYLIGDQVSLHPGWQEGAIASAHAALQHLDRRMANDGRRGAGQA